MKRVLLVYYSLIASVKVCALEQLKELQSMGKIQFIACESRQITRKLCAWCDIVIFVRSSSRFERRLAENFRKYNKFMIYIMDDDLLDLPEHISAYPYYSKEDVKESILSIMRNCHLFLSPSAELIEKYRDHFERTARIEEPCLSCIDKDGDIKEPVKIGFAGSIDRAKDVNDLLYDVIKRLQETYRDRIRIQFFGSKPSLVDELNLEYHPYMERYEDYQDKMLQLNWDVGLAPMPDTKFHSCKHYNKFIEYGAFSIVGVYSNVKPYSMVIEDGVNGVLCDNDPDAWFRAISSLIEDKEKIKAIRKNVNHQMKTRYPIEQVAKEYYKAVPEFEHYRKARRSGLFIVRMKMEDYVARGLGLLKRCLKTC